MPAPGRTTLVEEMYASQRKAMGAAPAPGRTTLVQEMYASQPKAMEAAPATTQQTRQPSGRHELTEFGEYWVVPDADAANQSLADAMGEQITETEFATATAAWAKVKDGSGDIKPWEIDRAGTAHAGFNATIISRIGVLMSKPHGRQLVSSLLTGGFVVWIRPTPGNLFGGGSAGALGDAFERADGSAGSGSDTVIEIDPACNDGTIEVFNKDGERISATVYTILGHELIHARHNQLGRNRRRLAPTDAIRYPNGEEEATIETGDGVTENKLRTEHGLDKRVGHRAEDTRER